MLLKLNFWWRGYCENSNSIWASVLRKHVNDTGYLIPPNFLFLCRQLQNHSQTLPLCSTTHIHTHAFLWGSSSPTPPISISELLKLLIVLLYSLAVVIIPEFALMSPARPFRALTIYVYILNLRKMFFSLLWDYLTVITQA